MSAEGKSRLGRGLDSLIGGSSPAPAATQPQPATEKKAQSVPTQPAAIDGQAREIPIEQVTPNPYQPRRNFDETQLEELAQSIRQEGILQPLVVTDAAGSPKAEKTGKPYVLIAGERRLRAAHLAGLTTVPCIFKEADERKMIEWAVIENIQRAELNPIERAQAYQDYMDRFKLTQQEVAERMGQARTTVANHLRLIDLSDDVQTLIASGQVSFGHAKVLAGLAGKPDKQARLAHRVVAEGLSVRRLEELVAGTKNPAQAKDPADQKANKPAYVRDVEMQLTESIGTKVLIQPGRAKNSGKIVVEYYSLDDFDKIAGALGLDMQD